MIITFLLYFCITAKGRSINPYRRDMRYLVIYLWRANRMLAAIWTTAEETCSKELFLVVQWRYCCCSGFLMWGQCYLRFSKLEELLPTEED